jgi:predicted nucleic-acid-binding protein
MIAVDTNLLARVLTHDDPDQARRAERILESEKVFIPKTVILETEWVLRFAYGIETNHILTGFKRLLGLPNVRVEDPDAVIQAISWFEHGLDFADALHSASSQKAERFATFDKWQKRRGSRLHWQSLNLN